MPGALTSQVPTSQPLIEASLQAPPRTPAVPKAALPPYPPIHSCHTSRTARHHHASRIRSERGRSRERHVDDLVPKLRSPSRTDLSPPAGSVFRPPPPDSAMGNAQMEHEAHLAHVSLVFGTRPTSVQVGGRLNSKISFRWANDDSGEWIMITEAHAALTASLLLGQGEVNWVQLSSFLEAMHDITPFSGGPDDFKILWHTLCNFATKDDKVSHFLEKHNLRMYNALRDRARKAETALQEAKDSSAGLVNLNAQLESRAARLLQDLDNSQVRNSRFESLLQSTTQALNATITKLQADNELIADKAKAAHQLHQKEALRDRSRMDHLQERNKALEAELAALKVARPGTPVMDARRDTSLAEELGDLQGMINVLRPRYLALLHSHPNPEHALAFLPQDHQASFAEILNLPTAELAMGRATAAADSPTPPAPPPVKPQSPTPLP